MIKKSLLLMLLMALLVPWAANAQSLFSEDFEGGSMPSGWTTDGSGSWTVGTGDYSTSTGAGQGTYNAKITHGTTGNATKLITPEIDLSSVTSAELSFMHIQRSWAGDIDNLKVYYRTSSSGSWTQLLAYTTAIATWTTEDGIALPNPSSTYQLAFEYTDNYGYGVGVDNIIIAQGASCVKPTALAGTPNGQSATLLWESDATSFDVAHSTDATANPADNIVATVNATTYTMDNLTIDEDHYFWVRANCSATDQSDWTNPVSVHIGYCVPAPSSVDNNGISNVTFGTGDNIVNNDTPKATYADYSREVGAVQAGVESTIAITFKTGYTYNTFVWVDLDNSLTFDADEVVCYGESTNSNPTTLTLNFTIPADQTLGDYRLRIGSADSGLGTNPTTADPCYTSSYGCFQDYTLRVLEAPSCLAPTGLTVSNVAGHSATISWTSDASAWQIQLGENTPIDVTEPTYTFTGLASETTFSVKVRTDCDGTYSDWSNPVNFTTTVACPAPTVAVNNITSTTADVTCTNTEASEFNLQLINPNVTPTDTTLMERVTMPYTLTGLTTDKSYKVRVQALCGGEDGESAWSSVVTFTTAEECPEGVICIGTGKTTSGYLPTYTYFNYSLTQQIYTAAEIGETGAILSIDFYSTAAERTRNLDIYMVMTDKASFASNTDFITVTASDLVYSGNVTFVKNDWTTIQLNTPFAYADDTKNVALIVNDKTGGYVNSPNFLVFAATNMALYAYNDNYGYDPSTPGTYSNGTYTFNQGNQKNRIRLVMGEIVDCDMPSNLAVSDITMQTANLTWTAGGSETAWQVCINGDEDHLIDVTNNAYQMTGLTAATTYTVKVRANCGSGQSYWTPEISFNTAICDAADQCEISYEFAIVNSTSYTTWHSATIDVVDVETNIVLATLTYDAAAPTGTVTVCNGREIKFVYNPATPDYYNSYNSYAFTDVNGEEIFSGSGTLSAPVTYTVDCTVTNCKKPTGLAASEIGNHSAKLSWTENGEATSWVVAYKSELATDFEEIDANENPYTLGHLAPETAYTVKVRSACEPGVEKWSDEITFTTDLACPAPTNLSVADITSNSAVISWNGEGSFDLRYGVVESSSKSTLFYDFEDGLGDWTTIDGDGDGFTWTLLSNIDDVTTWYTDNGIDATTWAYDGSDAVFSGSYLNGASVTTTPDNLLVSPMVTLGGSITFYAKGLDGDYPEHFGVCVSTTSNTDVSAFEVLQEWDTDTDTEYHEYTVDLSAYSGQGYIAIRNFNVDNMYIVIVDNVTIVEGAVSGDIHWSDPITGVTSPYSLTGLDPETTYMVQVRANCGEDGYSEWIQKGFVTKGVCDTPTALTTTNVEAFSATLGWTGVQDSYNVQYRTPAYRETLYYTEFDDEDLPEGWSNTGGHYWWQGTDDGWVFLGYTAAETQYLITPDLSEFEGAATIEFMQRYYGAATAFKVGFSTTTNDVDAFDWSDDIAATSSETLYSVAIPSGAKYFAVQVTTDEAQTQGIVIDDFGIYGEIVEAGSWVTVENVTSPYTLDGVLQAKTEYEWQVQGICLEGLTEWSTMASFTTEPTCLVPTDLTVSNITTESAVLAWESDAELFDIELNGRVFAEDVTNPYTLTLEPGTSYTVKVRAHCDGEDYSDWTSSISFLTPCTSFDLPYEYGFDDAATSDNPEFNCWSYGNLNSSNPNSPGLVYRDEETGDIAFRFNSISSSSVGYDQVLISPELVTETDITVSFEYKAYNASYPESFKVGYSIDGDSYTWFDEFTASNTDEYLTYTSDVMPAGTKYVAVYYTSNYCYYLFLDNFSFTEASVTQTIDLVEGWNRISVYIEVDPTDPDAPVAMLDMVKEKLGDNAWMIEGPTGDYTEFDGEEWWGDLDEMGIYNEYMYMIYAYNDCTIELEGMPVDPDQIEITLEPGWNRIGYPLTVDLNLVDDEPLANLEPEVGDLLEGPTGDYTEFDGEEWWGDVESFEAGGGYMYYNNSDETKYFVFNTSGAVAKSRRANKTFGKLFKQQMQPRVAGPCKSIVDPTKKSRNK